MRSLAHRLRRLLHSQLGDQGGDRIGVVDMLGVPQDVLAPGDGIIGSALVEAGDAVEFGQDLLEIELITPVSG